MLTMTNLSTECLIQLTKLGYDATPFNQILKQNAKREMRLRLGKVTVADVLAAQPVTTNLLKFMRASIKMIGVSNLQSFIASMTQKIGRASCRERVSVSAFLLNRSSDLYQAGLRRDAVQPDIEAERKKRDEIEAGKSYCRRRFGGATCDDKSAQIYARFDKNDWRIQPAEFYRFHDAEVNTFGYF